MKATGISTLLSAQRFAASSASLRRQAEAARTELTSGRIADLPKALGARIGEAFSVQGALDTIGFQKQSLAQARLVAATAQRVLTTIGEGGAALAAETIAASGRRDETALAAAALDARGKLRSTFSQLNASAAGQSLFAGDATDRAALANVDQFLADIEAIYATAVSSAGLEADLDTYFDDATGGFQSSIYTGGSGPAPSIEVSRGERLQFTVRADDQSVRDLLRGLASIAVAGVAPPSLLRESALASGAARALSGEDALTVRRAEIGVAENQTAEEASLLDAEEALLTKAFNTLTSRDPFEAASRLQSLEAQLNAALLITSRLSQLTLSNFLR